MNGWVEYDEWIEYYKGMKFYHEWMEKFVVCFYDILQIISIGYKLLTEKLSYS